LADEYQQLKLQWHGDARYDQWMQTINNAKLATIADYHQWTGAFRNLRRQSASWPEFYAAAKTLGELPKEQRRERLQQLSGSAPPMPTSF